MSARVRRLAAAVALALGLAAAVAACTEIVELRPDVTLPDATVFDAPDSPDGNPGTDGPPFLDGPPVVDAGGFD